MKSVFLYLLSPFFFTNIFAFLLVTNSYSEEQKAVKKDEKKIEKDKVVVVAAIETGASYAFSGNSSKSIGQKELIHTEAGAGVSGDGFEGHAVLFVTKDDVIRPGYFTAGFRMAAGNTDYYVGPVKFKGDVGWISQGDKDSSGHNRVMGGLYIKGLAGICTGHKDEAKVKLCIETFVKGIEYIEAGARLEAGYGLQIVGNVGGHKINMGARHTFMMASADLHDASDIRGQYFTLNVGMEFDVSGKSSKSNKK